MDAPQGLCIITDRVVYDVPVTSTAGSVLGWLSKDPFKRGLQVRPLHNAKLQHGDVVLAVGGARVLDEASLRAAYAAPRSALEISVTGLTSLAIAAAPSFLRIIPLSELEAAVSSLRVVRVSGPGGGQRLLLVAEPGMDAAAAAEAATSTADATRKLRVRPIMQAFDAILAVQVLAGGLTAAHFRLLTGGGGDAPASPSAVRDALSAALVAYRAASDAARVAAAEAAAAALSSDEDEEDEPRKLVIDDSPPEVAVIVAALPPLLVGPAVVDEATFGAAATADEAGAGTGAAAVSTAAAAIKPVTAALAAAAAPAAATAGGGGAQSNPTSASAPSEQNIPSSRFAVGDAVVARFHGMGKRFFSGRISAVTGSGLLVTYSIVYEDGDVEDGALPENVRRAGAGRHARQSAAPPASASAAALEGDDAAVAAGVIQRVPHKKGAAAAARAAAAAAANRGETAAAAAAASVGALAAVAADVPAAKRKHKRRELQPEFDDADAHLAAAGSGDSSGRSRSASTSLPLHAPITPAAHKVSAAAGSEGDLARATGAIGSAGSVGPAAGGVSTGALSGEKRKRAEQDGAEPEDILAELALEMALLESRKEALAARLAQAQLMKEAVDADNAAVAATKVAADAVEAAAAAAVTAVAAAETAAAAAMAARGRLLEKKASQELAQKARAATARRVEELKQAAAESRLSYSSRF